MEFPATGGVLPSPRIISFQIYSGKFGVNSFDLKIFDLRDVSFDQSIQFKLSRIQMRNFTQSEHYHTTSFSGVGTMGKVVLAAEIFYVMILIYFIIRESIKIKNDGKKYLQ